MTGRRPERGEEQALQRLVGPLLTPLRDRLAGAEHAEPSGPGFVDALAQVSAEQGQVFGVHDLYRVAAVARHNAVGLGPLHALVEQREVTDVLVTGGGLIWVDRGAGLSRAGALDGGESEARALAVRLAALAGRRLDESLPWVDARLPGGVRLHAVVPPVSPEGTHISLRILRTGPRRLSDLAGLGALPQEWLSVLEAMVAHRAAFLISGGTGAGKTTLLAAMLGSVPSNERIVLVEDVGELAPDHPHVVRLEARHANVEGRGEVSLDVLVRQALRMRPDRLVVGECRGAEVRDLLAALNTGHAGGCGTVHANSAAEVPARLEALGLVAGLGREGVAAQAAAGLDAVIHVRRRSDAGGRSVREVVEIATIGRDASGELAATPALTRGRDGGTRTGPGWPALARRLEGTARQ